MATAETTTIKRPRKQADFDAAFVEFTDSITDEQGKERIAVIKIADPEDDVWPVWIGKGAQVYYNRKKNGRLVYGATHRALAARSMLRRDTQYLETLSKKTARKTTKKTTDEEKSNV